MPTKVDIPEYGTHVNFPDDMSEEDIQKELDSNFPPIKTIINDDGSWKIDITKLPVMPIVPEPREELTLKHNKMHPIEARRQEEAKLMKLWKNPKVSDDMRAKISDRLFQLDALEDPFVDPVTAFAGGAGAVGFLTKNIGKGLLAGLTSLATEPVIGQATEFVAEEHPGLAFPFALAVGIASGSILEAPVERTILRAVNKTLGKKGLKATTEALQAEIDDLTAKFEAGTITSDEIVKLGQVIKKPLKAKKPVKAAEVVPEAKPEIAVEGPIGDVKGKPKEKGTGRLDDPAEIAEEKVRAEIDTKTTPEDIKKTVESTISDFEVGKITEETARSKLMNLSRFSNEDIVFNPKAPAEVPIGRDFTKKELRLLKKEQKIQEKILKKERGATIKKMATKRLVDITEETLNSSDFIRKATKGLTKPELEAIPFMREGLADTEALTKIGRDDIANVINNPSPKAKQALKEIGDYLDESFQFLKDNHDGLNFVENYVTHIWDIPKGKKQGIVNHFTTKNPFTKKRKIPTLEEGIALGLKPKTTNIKEILQIYDQYKIKTVFNKQYADAVKNMTDEFGSPLLAKRGTPGTEAWPEVDHPVLNKTMAAGVKGEKVVLAQVPTKVHPDIAKDLEVVLGKPFDGGFVNSLENISAFVKASTLKASFFHAGALTEAAIASGIGVKAFKMWNPVKLYRQLSGKKFLGKEDTLAIFKDTDAAKDGIRAGLTLDPSPDVQKGRVQNMLRSAERFVKDVPVLREAAKGLRKVNDVWDEALWTYYHSTLKLMAYEAQKGRALKLATKKVGKELTPKQVKKVKETVAGFVNDTFGGQMREVDRFWDNPRIQQVSQMLMLSVDWQRSTIKQALAPIRGVTGATGLKAKVKAGKMSPEDAVLEQIKNQVLRRRGVSFWLKTGAIYGLAANALNYRNTEKQTGEGRFLWENPEGRKFDIFYKKGDEDAGTPDLYISPGKQFREPINWVSDPLATLGNKLNPAIREIFKQATGASPGSGFPSEWKRDGIENVYKQLPARVVSALKVPIPFSLRPYVDDRPGTFMFMFPTKTGLSNFKARNMFEKALKNEDYEKINKIYTWALDNNLKPDKLYSQAKAKVKREFNYGNKEYAKDIYDEMVSLEGEDEKLDLLKAYKQRDILTPDILLQLNKLITNTKEVKEMRADPRKHFNLTLGFDRLTQQVLEGKANKQDIENYMEFADKKTKRKFRRRLKMAKKLAKVGLDKDERRFWLDLGNVSKPKDRASAYHLRWTISSEEERKELNSIIRKLPKVTSSSFWKEFKKLKGNERKTAEIVLENSERPDIGKKEFKEALFKTKINSGKTGTKINMGIIAEIESNFDDQAVNPKSGATGLFQIAPIGLKEWNRVNGFLDEKGNPKEGALTMEDMKDPAKNFEVSVETFNKIIPQQLRAFGIEATLDNVLMGYNAGTGHLDKVFKGKETLFEEPDNYRKKYKKILERIGG